MNDAHTQNGVRKALAAMVAHFTQRGTKLGYDSNAQSCKYRADGDAGSPYRCAVGSLISDDDYDAAVEGDILPGDEGSDEYNQHVESWGVATLVRVMPSLRFIFNLAEGEDVRDDHPLVEFLVGAQRLHDTIAASDSTQVGRFLEQIEVYAFAAYGVGTPGLIQRNVVSAAQQRLIEAQHESRHAEAEIERLKGLFA